MASSEIFNIDCIELMARYPDKHFDLAVVDPPYGIDAANMNLGKGGGVARHNDHKKKDWDKQVPTSEYWKQLFRVSKNQIGFFRFSLGRNVAKKYEGQRNKNTSYSKACCLV